MKGEKKRHLNFGLKKHKEKLFFFSQLKSHFKTEIKLLITIFHQCADEARSPSTPFENPGLNVT